MGFKLQLLLVLVGFGSLAVAQSNYSFPDDFMLGAASSSYQIEGGVDEDGKSENIWDRMISETPSKTNNQNADVACDSYHKYKEDAELLAAVNASHYRFSISWSRILSTLYQNEPNLAGIKYYQNLVDELLARNVTPVATMYHWDLPQSLQDVGGWMNKEMVYHFENYARVLYKYLPKVEHWITFNEPLTLCKMGYSNGQVAPGLTLPGIAEYTCTYVVLNAHAAAYRVYKDEFPELNGKISLAIDGHWAEPASNSTEDVEAAERKNQFEIGMVANPIVNGNWPQVVIDRVAYRSKMENFTKSRLPVFTEEESNKLKGSFDYFSVNYYMAQNVSDGEEASFESISFNNDQRTSGGMEMPGGGGGGGSGPGQGGIGGGIGGGSGGGIGGGSGGGSEGGIGGGPGGGIGGGSGGGIGGGPGGGSEGGIGGGSGGGSGVVGPSNQPSSSWAMRKSLNWLRTQYGDMEIFIMENGINGNEDLNDESRMEFLQEYFTVLLEMIHEDNLKVIGYTLWSLLDNFQWWEGYSSRYGLYHVDFDDANRTRTARLSAQYFKEIASTHRIPDEFPEAS